MPTDWTIRLAVDADAARIAEMSRDLIEHGLPWSWRPGRVQRAIRDMNTNVAVAGPAGLPIAFGIMEYREDDAHLVLFAVDARHRRAGIGTSLLAWLEQVARVAGAQRIEVETPRRNAAARSFYNEHGYHEWAIERGMYSERVDGVRLEKWLRQVIAAAGQTGT